MLKVGEQVISREAIQTLSMKYIRVKLEVIFR